MPDPSRLFCSICSLLLLTACGVQPVSATQTSMPTVTPPPTATTTPFLPSPSPVPTEPSFPALTPDPDQIQRWNEYEDALAIALFNGFYSPEAVVCEWTILGRADLEVYVSAYCSNTYAGGPSAAWVPAVIHLRADGSVESAETPGSGTAYARDIRSLFPAPLPDVILGRVKLPYSQEMDDRMRWRRGHPDEPPFIVLHSLAIQPTPPVIPWIQPDAAHVENWREYQLVVAKVTLSYVPAEQVLCEWEILGQAQGQVYVWRICSAMGESGSLEGLATVLIDADGSPQNAIDSGIGDRAYIQQTFPQDVQERYFSGLIHFQELVSRLHWRKSHPDDPPLIVVGLQSP